MLIKNYLIILFISSFVLTQAQEDSSIFGYVILQNSKTYSGYTEFVSNVSISSNEGYFKSQLSDSNGYFEIIVADKSVGENIELNVQKEGYVIINKDVLNCSVSTTFPITDF